MHELDYGSFEIKSDLGESHEAARIEVTARCICGAEMWAAAQTFVQAKYEVEARFVEHAGDVNENGNGEADIRTD